MKPNQVLSKYIKKISVFKSSGKLEHRQKITSTPFTYLSFNLSDVGITTIDNKKYESIEKFHFDGPKISDSIFIDYNGRLHRILIEFQASGFYYLFHKSPSQITNKLINLSSFTNEFDNANLSSLNSTEKQVDVIEKFLINKCNQAIPFNIHIENALHLIQSNFGNISISDICKNINLSDRHFNRTFRNIVGVSPKLYSKLIQFHYIINLMKQKNYGSVQKIAYDAKFYDSAHLNHRFKELTGLSPNEFLVSDKHIALKYFTDMIK